MKLSEITADLIDRRYKTLPPELERVIFSDTYTQTVANIGKKHGLHIDQIEQLRRLVEFVLLGLVRADEFVTEAKILLSVPQDTLQKIIGDVNTQVLEEVREAIRDFSEGRLTAEAQAKKKTPGEEAPGSKLGEARRELQGVQTTEVQQKESDLGQISSSTVLPNQTPPEQKQVTTPPPSDTSSVAQPTDTAATPQVQEGTPKRYPDGVDPYREPIN